MSYTAQSLIDNGMENKYLFGGKELQDDLGLNLYDFSARMYDAQLGRWHSPDPLEQFNSGYVYAANNPINMIDPSGMWSFPVYVNGKYSHTASGGNDEEENNEEPPDEYIYNAKTKKKTYKSDLGGKDINYIHHEGGENDGRTEIVNTNTKDKTWMSTSEFIKGYTHRQTNWFELGTEFEFGTGPEKSLISGSWDQMIRAIMKSPQFAIVTQAYMDAGAKKTWRFGGAFGISGAWNAGDNMTAQMIGKAAFNFYRVGDRLVIMATDSKSISSVSFNPLVKLISKYTEFLNVPRKSGQTRWQSTTYQTYIWSLPIRKKLE